MRRLAPRLLLLLTGACAAGPPPGEGPPLFASVLPPGWRLAEEPRLYRGADLFGLINGGSELYLELGFDRLERAACVSGEDRVILELYRMADPLAALGAFLARAGRAGPMAGLGPFSAAAEGLIQFAHGSCLAAVYDASRTPGAARALPEFALRLAAALPGPPGDPLAGMALGEAVPGTLRIVRGPFTLQTVTTMIPPAALSLADADFALAFDTPSGEASAVRIHAAYRTPEAARTAFGRFAAGLEGELQILEKSPGRAVFTDGFEFGLARLDGSALELQLHLPAAPRN